MQSEFIRPVAIDTHPLVQQKYIVPTPSIDSLYLNIKRCLKLRVPGAIIYAMTRWGKTYAARYVALMLKADFPRLVVFTFDCHSRSRPSESAFFTNLLRHRGPVHVPARACAGAVPESLFTHRGATATRRALWNRQR